MPAVKMKVEPPWFGSFTPADPAHPTDRTDPTDRTAPPLPVPEAIPAVPNTYPAGQTYEGFLYGIITSGLSGMGDTVITSPAGGDTLLYDSGLGKWINSPLSGAFLPIAGGTITGTPGNLIVNAPAGDTGAILTAQVDGVRRMLISADSDHILELTDTANTGPTATLQISHRTSSGTPTTGFGSSLQFWGEDSGHSRVHYGTLRTEASDTTPGAVSADLVMLNQQAGSSVEALRVKGSDGRAQFAVGVQSPYLHVGDLVTHPATAHISRAGVAADPAVYTYLRVKGVADTGIGTGVDPVDVDFALDRTLQLATGARSHVKAMQVTGVTYSAVGASTITEATGLFLNSLPVAGTNVTLSNRYALYVNGPSRFESGSSGGITYVWRLPQDDTPVGAAVGRIPVNINGTLRYVPYHAA